MKNTQLCKTIKKEMVDREVTQSELAVLMGVSSQTLSNVLNGKKECSIEFLYNLGISLSLDSCYIYAHLVMPYVNYIFTKLDEQV